MPKTAPDPAESAGYLLWQLTHRMHQLMIDALKDLDLVPAQVGALAHVARNDAASNAELARRLLMTPQNMSLTTAKLEEAGYLRKAAHESHGRIRKLEVTAAGLVVLGQATRRMAGVEDRMLAHMTAAQREQFREALGLSLAALLGED